jgi:gluconate 2-dehydrogenase alpha chain
MAKVMKSVDAVMVGMGWSGSIMARELTKAGLTVVGIERGVDKSPGEDFALPRIRDELKYRVRQELMLDTAVETHTLRNIPSELALPMRKWDIPPVGDGLGGAGAHWNGVTWRFIPSEFALRSHLTARYGRNAIPEDMTIQDWGITYDDLEPHYEHFERLCGTSGKAGNLRGQKIDGGNPFEGPRQNDYPNKPLIMSQAGMIFSKAAQSLGYHPFPTPASNSSAPYTNSEGLPIGQLRQRGQEGPRRRLYRPAHRRGGRAARRHGGAVRLCVQQYAAPAAFRHRRTLRPGDRQGRRRQELLPPDHVERHDVRRRRDQSVDRHRHLTGRDR